MTDPSTGSAAFSPLDLGALLTPRYPDPDQQLLTWTKAFVRGSPTDTLSLLKDLNIGTCNAVGYEAREDEGTQSPLQTLERDGMVDRETE